MDLIRERFKRAEEEHRECGYGSRKRKSTVTKKIKVEESSGNVFADLGLPNAEERLAKADLAFRITETIRARHLTQTAAAKLFETDQPKVSRLVRGQLAGFSADRLMHFLTLLGRDVEIIVKLSPHPRRPGHLRVIVQVPV